MSSVVAARAPRLKRNFGTYAAMEGANVVFVPAFALWLGWPRSASEIAAMAVSIMAVSGLLVVGTLFWRGVDRRLKSGDSAALDQAVQFADRAQRPMALVTGASIAGAILGFAIHGASHAAIAAAALSFLALLEYVNYYHWQLQIFDNAADFRRLISTGRFKRARLARALAATRAEATVSR